MLFQNSPDFEPAQFWMIARFGVEDFFHSPGRQKRIIGSEFQHSSLIRIYINDFFFFRLFFGHIRFFAGSWTDIWFGTVVVIGIQLFCCERPGLIIFRLNLFADSTQL